MKRRKIFPTMQHRILSWSRVTLTDDNVLFVFYTYTLGLYMHKILLFDTTYAPRNIH